MKAATPSALTLPPAERLPVDSRAVHYMVAQSPSEQAQVATTAAAPVEQVTTKTSSDSLTVPGQMPVVVAEPASSLATPNAPSAAALKAAPAISIVEGHLLSFGIPAAAATQYAAKLVEDGYENGELFDSLSLEELRDEYGFKKGHLRAVERSREAKTAALDRADTSAAEAKAVARISAWRSRGGVAQRKGAGV